MNESDTIQFSCKSCILLADSSPPILVDQSPAPATSFLSQECNATVKYAASGRYRDLVPSTVYHLYPSAKKMLKSGFFAVEVLPKILEKESAITKVQNGLEYNSRQFPPERTP